MIHLEALWYSCCDVKNVAFDFSPWPQEAFLLRLSLKALVRDGVDCCCSLELHCLMYDPHLTLQLYWKLLQYFCHQINWTPHTSPARDFRRVTFLCKIIYTARNTICCTQGSKLYNELRQLKHHLLYTFIILELNNIYTHVATHDACRTNLTSTQENPNHTNSQSVCCQHLDAHTFPARCFLTCASLPTAASTVATPRLTG
jgi:hypothetical protein